MLNALCNEPLDHAPSTHLPNELATYRKFGAHLAKIEQQPNKVCFNCGVLNYLSSTKRIVVKAAGTHDLRAWRVFSDSIEAFSEQLGVPLEEVFLCEEVPAGSDGHERRRVYSCASCEAEKCQDPTKYDLFDGHAADARDPRGYSYEPNGVGEPTPEPLAQLDSTERLLLGVVKMADATFDPPYSSTGYGRFSNGGLLTPGDYHGWASMLVTDPTEAAAALERTDESTATAMGRRTLRRSKYMSPRASPVSMLMGAAG